jgi:hypothetical protein
MKTWRTGVTGAVAAILATGCGTFGNLAGGIRDPENRPTVYGGVRHPPWVEYLLDYDQRTHSKLVLVWWPLWVADGGLSFVGDTLTLPLTAYLNDKRVAERQSRERQIVAEEAAAGSAESPPTVSK